MTGAGELTERLGFDKRGTASDGAGGTETTWQPQFEVWAKATFLRGGEAVLAARLEGRQPVVFRVRRSLNTRQVTADWRVRDIRTGSVYAIRSVIQSEDRAWIDFTAEGGVAA